MVLFLGELTEYFNIRSPTFVDEREAYIDALGLSLFSIALVLVLGVGAFMGYKTGMLFRIICANAVYKKVSIILIVKL